LRDLWHLLCGTFDQLAQPDFAHAVDAPPIQLGVWITLFGVGVRAEYERIHVDELDKVSTVSLSAFYQFWSSD
jgi:hypothetical protein